MPTMTGFQRLPKFFKLVGKPASVSTRDLEDAQPIYIDGLAEGGAGGTTLPENTSGERAVLVAAANGTLSWLKVSDLIEPHTG